MRLLPAFTAALLTVVPTLPAAAQSMPTTLTLTAEARVERAPDLAEITAGVTSQGETAAQASRANAEQMARVISAVRAAHIAERDIQTVGLNLQPQYDYQNNHAPRLTGYQAGNSVSIRLHDLPRAGTIIDALVAAGANQIGGPTFRIADEDRVLDEARTAAVGKARARAELYARAAGLRVARILRIAEGGAEPPMRPMPMMRAMAVQSASAPTPVAPGEVALSAQVTIDFELQ